jgi:hypothetical protein
MLEGIATVCPVGAGTGIAPPWSGPNGPAVVSSGTLLGGGVVDVLFGAVVLVEMLFVVDGVLLQEAATTATAHNAAVTARRE